jgi:hypothetical protein
MRAIGLLCVLCSASTGCIFLESGGGGGDDVASCDTAILCMEIDSGNNSNAGMLAFRDDCTGNGADYITASCVGDGPVCRNVALVAGEEDISVVVDIHYKAGYESATGNAPADDCSNVGGSYEDDGPPPNNDCPDPSFPVFCGEFEGDCWSEGVNCSFPAYDCGGSRWRCLNGSDFAACCNDTFVTCGSEFPYYCASDNMCYATDQGCAGSCTFIAATCD